MRITDNMRPDCISVCFYQIRYEHPHHPQRRYNALHAAACFETKGDFGQEICTHFPKERDDISALSYVNPLVVDDFSGAASNIAGIAVPKLRFQFLFRAVFSDWAVHNRPAGYMCRLFLHKCFHHKNLLRFLVLLFYRRFSGKTNVPIAVLSEYAEKEYEPFDSYSRFLPAMPVAACFSNTALCTPGKTARVF